MKRRTQIGWMAIALMATGAPMTGCDEPEEAPADEATEAEAAEAGEETAEAEQPLEPAEDEGERIAPPGWQLTLTAVAEELPEGMPRTVSLAGEVVVENFRTPVTDKETPTLLIRLTGDPKAGGAGGAAEIIAFEAKPKTATTYPTSRIHVLVAEPKMRCKPIEPVTVDIEQYTTKYFDGTVKGVVECDKHAYEVSGEFHD